MGLRRLAPLLGAAAAAAAALPAARAPESCPAGSCPVLLDRWSLGTNLSQGGAALSAPGFSPSGPEWTAVAVPCTVLACLQQAGQYPDLYFGANIDAVPAAQFNFSWWYVTTIPPAALPPPPARASLRFKGVNYRANVWVSGQLAANASAIVGTFRYFDVPLPSAGGGGVGVAVEVMRPFDRALPASNKDLDLAVTFVDWAPAPPDGNMGLWREVELHTTTGGGVALADPGVLTALPPPSAAGPAAAAGAPPASFAYANLTVLVTARNWDDSRAVAGTLAAAILAPDNVSVLATVSAAATLQPGEEARLALPAVTLAAPALWWPWQMGNATLHFVRVTFTPASATAPSDTAASRFGVRTASSSLDAHGNRLFRVNGQRLLVRGGGWSPDLLLRPDAPRLAAQLAMARHMGLNAIRLEGKMDPDEFFDALDELGMLALPGWCCCDAWQHWPEWTPTQYAVAAASLTSQLRRLMSHASVATFLISSDELPPADVEGMYLAVAAHERWGEFAGTISSASALVSNITGPTGVKMSGPYSWVPPNYWLLDTQGGTGLGGGWGFLTEGGPGENPLPYEALVASVNATWPPSPGDCWGHCGSPLGNFGGLARFNGPLAARYGNASTFSSLRRYLWAAQAAAAEGHRAFMEAYARNKYANATGFIAWMLNAAWPSNIWHLFPWDLSETSTYTFARAATGAASAGAGAGLHALYSYDADPQGVWLVNSGYAPAPAAAPLRLVATLLAVNDTTLWSASATLPAGGVPADGAVRLPGIALPAAAAVSGMLAPGEATYLLRLQLFDEAAALLAPGAAAAVGGAAAAALEDATYWLSTMPDVLDWAASTWYNTPLLSAADLTGLARLPPATLRVDAAFSAAVDWAALSPNDAATLQWYGRASGVVLTQATVTLTNAGAGVALLVRLRLLDVTAGGSQGVAPVFWSANFVTLRGGEVATVTAVFAAAAAPGQQLRVAADCFNCGE